jgi:hypothetical protein
MNYLYQFGNFIPGVNAPLDYSRFSMNPIVESSLNDAIGIRPASVPLGLKAVVGGTKDGGVTALPPTLADTGAASTFDWNRVTGVQSGYSQNVHYFDLSDCRNIAPTTLTSYADWPNLNLVFKFEANFLDGVIPALEEIDTDEIAELHSLGIATLNAIIQDLPDEAFATPATADTDKDAISDALADADALVVPGEPLDAATTELHTTVRALIVDRIENTDTIPYEDSIIALLDELIDSFSAEVVIDTKPAAADLAVAVEFATPTTINLVGSDPDGTPVTYTIVSGPVASPPALPTSAGTLGTPSSEGEVLFTPAADFEGKATFTYKVSSEGDDSNTATVFITVLSPDPTPVSTVWHLDADSSGAKVLNPIAPTNTIPKKADSGKIAFKSGNPYKTFGTWKVAAPVGYLTDLDDFNGVFSLKSLKDVKARFDIKAEVFRTSDGELVASGTLLCQNTVQIMFPLIKELQIPLTFEVPGTTHFDDGDELLIKISTRMGTKLNGSSCGGNSSAEGLLLWFDAKKVDSFFGTSILLD